MTGNARAGAPPAPPTPLCVKRNPARCSVQPVLLLPGATRPAWSAAPLA